MVMSSKSEDSSGPYEETTDKSITTRCYADGHTLTITDKAMVERDSQGNVTHLRVADKEGNWTPEEDSEIVDTKFGRKPGLSEYTNKKGERLSDNLLQEMTFIYPAQYKTGDIVFSSELPPPPSRPDVVDISTDPDTGAKTLVQKTGEKKGHTETLYKDLTSIEKDEQGNVVRIFKPEGDAVHSQEIEKFDKIEKRVLPDSPDHVVYMNGFGQAVEFQGGRVNTQPGDAVISQAGFSKTPALAQPGDMQALHGEAALLGLFSALIARIGTFLSEQQHTRGTENNQNQRFNPSPTHGPGM